MVADSRWPSASATSSRSTDIPRADFGNRGVLANEYISAMRELFESNAPEFHGQHIDYSDVLFSPRPSHGAPIFVGGNSRAALKRAAAFGDGWYGLWRSIQQYSEAGVDRLVIEPVSADLGVFLGQLEQFAQQVIPQLAPASALQSASEANSLMDPALLAGTMVI
ncbi:MAG TPA: LLM class flavin-dependent oxidoreductase [Mycobacterium sp.]|nr:LLM class flavin-dependent oxidoreductase [Mycobacterium sp.]